MILYLAIAVLGTLLLVVSAIFGEVFDFVGGDAIDVDGHGGTGKVVAVGMTAFGATGLIAGTFDWEPLFTALTAACAALFLGALTWWLIDRLYQSSASTDFNVASILGRRAQVTVNIPAGSVGEVLITAANSTRHMIARASDGGAIPAGTSVKVVETMGSMVVVERADVQHAAVKDVQTA